MKLTLEVINSLAKSLNENGLTELQLEVEGIKLQLKNEPEKNNVISSYKSASEAIYFEEKESLIEIKESLEEESIDNLEGIFSPMVGTFYSAGAPGALPFVVEGQEVKEGELLCVIEAMKLMNEVRAFKNCKIEKINAVDGAIIKKGEKLFSIS
ncbi:MAG: acetyl-CoA carboxylase biotin carboxyl carrier protein [Fusobacteriaceae bacterium]